MPQPNTQWVRDNGTIVDENDGNLIDESSNTLVDESSNHLADDVSSDGVEPLTEWEDE